MVCLLTPNSRPTSAALRPASICFSAPIISTSLYFRFVMPPLPPHSATCENHISPCADLGEQVRRGSLSRGRSRRRSYATGTDPPGGSTCHLHGRFNGKFQFAGRDAWY